MSATLNGVQCSRAEFAIPAHGVPYGCVEISGADPIAEGSRVSLRIAGLTATCTVTTAGERGGVAYYELVGGAGGWGGNLPAATPDGGYRNDAGVPLSTVVTDLARIVGEPLAIIPTALDRSMGVHFVRGGEQNAGALLSLVCSLPEGAPRIPWYVTLPGVTTLGERPALPAVTATEVDRDGYGTWVAYAEEDASSLLPGATVEGRRILSLEIRAEPSGIREVVTLADAAQGQTLMGELRLWVLALLRALFLTRGIYAYRITDVSADGRFDAVAIRSRFAPALDGLRLWPGASGHAARPKVGSSVLVSFIDADPGQPVVLGFQPLSPGLGTPTRATYDGERVDLGDGASGELVARLTDQATAGTLTIVNTVPAGGVIITYTPPLPAIPNIWTLTGPSVSVTPPSTNSKQLRAEIDDVDQTKVFA